MREKLICRRDISTSEDKIICERDNPTSTRGETAHKHERIIWDSMKLDYAPGRVSISDKVNSAEIRVLVSELSVAARHCAISEAAILRTFQPKSKRHIICHPSHHVQHALDDKDPISKFNTCLVIRTRYW
jgi:hypothetical protein